MATKQWLRDDAGPFAPPNDTGILSRVAREYQIDLPARQYTRDSRSDDSQIKGKFGLNDMLGLRAKRTATTTAITPWTPA